MFKGKKTVSDYLIDKMAAYGAKHVFGVPGDYILNFYKNMSNSSKVEVITTCDEQGAGFAADAYSRMNGFAAIVVTYGAGALKLVNSTAQAFAERCPVVIISGSPTRKEVKEDLMVHHRVGAFDTELKIFQNITVASAYINESNAIKEIDRVFEVVKRESGPGYIEIPMDVVDAIIQDTNEGVDMSMMDSALQTVSSPVLADAISEVVEMISKAKNPVVMVGVDVHRFKLADQVTQWIEKNYFPFVTDMLSKAVISESHPNFLGLYQGAMSRKDLTQFVESSDCIIKLGYYETDFNLGKYTANLDIKKTIMVKKEKIMIGYHSFEQTGLAAFMGAILKTDIPRGPRIPKEDWPQWQRCRPFKADPSKKLTVIRMLECIEEVLKSNPSVVIPDTGVALFGSSEIRLPDQCKLVAGAYYASMGYAVPAGIGASLGDNGMRSLVLVGDGCFQMTGAEISTAVKTKLNPIIVVLNNDGYTTERILQEGPFDDIGGWQYHKITDVIGGKGCLVNTEKEFFDALQKAYATQGMPSVIECRFDRLDLPPVQQRQVELQQRK